MDASPCRWTTVVVQVDPAGAELASDRLWSLGAAGIEERAAADGLVALLAGFPTTDGAEHAAAEVLAAGLGEVSVRAVTDDGLDAWRAFAAPVTAGPFVLVPAWLDAPDDGVHRVLRLDPGRTFGSGSHPTTRLVVAALAGLVNDGDRVLDVGCGSGVLAVAAAMLGGRADAIDIDPLAPGATEANAAANGVADRVAASNRALAELAAGPPFDLVLANLLAPVVADLAPELVRATAVGGHLVVSGLLADRWEATAAQLHPLAVTEVLEEDGWVAVVLRRT